MQSLKTHSGFTFVELSLAVLFISILALSVALVANNITSIYTKGLTIKSVNATGSDLIEEFAVGISAAPATELTALCEELFSGGRRASDINSPVSSYRKCLNNSAEYFVYSYRFAPVISVYDTTKTKYNRQLSGSFCTGKYSYIWNTGYTNNPLHIDSGGNTLSSSEVEYQIRKSDGTIETHSTVDDFPNGFRLLRLEDPSRVACISHFENYGDSNNIQYPESAAATVTSNYVYELLETPDGVDYYLPSEPVELIHGNENALAIYKLVLAPPSQDSITHRLFYAGSFVLATLEGGANISASSDYCEVKSFDTNNKDITDDFNYCAINKFNFAAQAMGK